MCYKPFLQVWGQKSTVVELHALDKQAPIKISLLEEAVLLLHLLHLCNKKTPKNTCSSQRFLFYKKPINVSLILLCVMSPIKIIKV